MINLCCLILLSSAVFQFENSRRILIFGKDLSQAKTQLNWLTKDSIGIAERDIDIIQVKEGGNLLSQYGVTSNQFTIILIGKDGGEKFRSLKPETTETLFTIIDAMPMRRSEMKNR